MRRNFPGFACIRSAWRPAWFGLMRIFPPFPPHRALQMVIGHWSLVIGHWSLVIGHWSLVTGHWSLVRSRRAEGPRTTNYAPSTKHQSTTYHLPPTAYRPIHRRTDAPRPGHRPPLFSDPRVPCRYPPCFGEAEREEKSRGRAGVCPMVRDARWVSTAADR